MLFDFFCVCIVVEFYEMSIYYNKYMDENWKKVIVYVKEKVIGE